MSVKCTALVWELSGLSTPEKLVLLAFADNANDDGECWPGIERIQKKCGYKHPKALQRTINKLIQKNLLSCESRYRKDGRQTTNLYTINLKNISEIIHSRVSYRTSPPCPTGHPHPVLQDTGPPPKNAILNNKNNTLQDNKKNELSRVTNNITKREGDSLNFKDYDHKPYDFNESELGLIKSIQKDPMLIFEKFRLYGKKKKKKKFNRNDVYLWVVREIEFSNEKRAYQ